jgi:hypothetical protein
MKMGPGEREEGRVNEPAPGGRELVAILYDCKGREPVCMGWLGLAWAGLGSGGGVVEEGMNTGLIKSRVIGSFTPRS